MKAIARILTNLEQPGRIMNAVGLRAVGLVQGNIKAGRFTPNAPLTQEVKRGDKPLRDRGLLFSSIAYKVQGNLVVIGTNHPAAPLLHYGGTVRPRNSRFLAIPAGARTRTLMRSYGQTARDCIEGMKGAGYKVWAVVNKDARVILAQAGKKGATFPLFFLKRSVKIPARPFMRIGQEGAQKLARVVFQELKR